jgi:hypothetical protein
MERLNPGDRGYPPALAPGQEIDGGAGIGPPRVGVADVGGEEFQEADLRPLAGGRDDRRQ